MKINKEKHEKILEIYNAMKRDAKKAIDGYKKAWKGTEKEVFAEMDAALNEEVGE